MNSVEMKLDGPHLGPLREANSLLGIPGALRARMEEDGYLLIRGLHDRERVLAARRKILERVEQDGHLVPKSPPDLGLQAPGKGGAWYGGNKSVTHSPEFLGVVENPKLLSFFSEFLGSPALTYDYKWLRVVGHRDYTGAHYDIVYMGRGTHRLFTLWTPYGDLSLDMGPLMILEGSHKFARLKDTYGKTDVDRDNIGGWFSDNPLDPIQLFGGRWLTSEFRAGDALIFSPFTMHASLDNMTSRMRLSSDTRYQSVMEPVDGRWVGEKPLGHYAWMKTPVVPMAEMRRKWGF